MVLECSGNRRSYFNPRTYGEQWEDGAISQGVWKGTALSDLLQICGIKNSAVEVVFEGHDFGNRKDMDGIFRYARSLPLKKALVEDTIIAYELNDESIPFEHGFPLRLIVPQWYGMSSVKWLKQIKVIDHEFKGPFQAVDYMYYPYKENDLGKTPVTNIKIDSIIQQPMNYEILDTGIHEIYGIAWTGTGEITEVELSVDGGSTWHNTKLFSQHSSEPYSWTIWSYEWNVPEKGEYVLISRAKDSEGSIQPFEAEWNRKGYGYNSVYSIKVKVE
jgi:DMSO/TMAO reductase YedYZ molybdopterin-dependent catalytic subunit